jgi:hypothetical protein
VTVCFSVVAAPGRRLGDKTCKLQPPLRALLLTLPTVGERRVRRPGAWRVQDEAVFPLPNSKPPFWRTWVGIGATVEVKVKVEVVRDEEVMAGEGVLAVTDLGVGEELLSMELDA